MNELSTFDPAETRPRELVDIEQLREARARGWLIEDPERRRPRYFDGRFLAAPDLTRDQAYFLSKQLDLGRLSGGGVITGLLVQGRAESFKLDITPGHGVTPSGESVLIQQTVTVDFSDVATIQRLDATFGLEVRPNAPVRNTTGLFVIALRNVEFTANPVATYPKDLQSQRRIEDGEIIEATAVTLIPLETVASGGFGSSGRAALARDIFLRKVPTKVPAEALPLAVVSLLRGSVEWVDRHLVRRDASVDDSFGFGLPHRAVREAFARQYIEHLAAVAPSEPFSASDHFDALPPFGPVPNQILSVVGDQFVQSFFPPEFSVELTIVPEDELAALQEESLTLPPIDLRARAATAAAASIQLLVPVPRLGFPELVSRLEGKLTRVPLPRDLRPRTRRSLNDTLVLFRGQLLRLPSEAPVSVNLQPWQDALSALGSRPLFFLRRRRLTEVAFSFARFQSLPPAFPNPSETLGNVVFERLVDAGEAVALDGDPTTQSERLRFDLMLRQSTNEVLVRVEALLSRPLFDTRAAAPRDAIARLFVNGVVAELAYRTRVRLEELIVSTDARASVIGTAEGVIAPEGSAPVRVRTLRVDDVARVARRYGRAGLGSGFSLLLATAPGVAASDARGTIAESFRIPELDQTTVGLPQAERQAFALDLLANATSGDIGAIRDMVDLQFAPPDAEAFPSIPGFPGSDVAIDVGEGRLYHLVHAFASPNIRQRLSALLSRPQYDQHVVVGMLLGELVVNGWNLSLTNNPASSDDALNVATLLTRIAQWNPVNPTEFDVEDLRSGPGAANLSESNVAVVQTLTAYEVLSGVVGEERLAELTNLLVVENGFEDEPDRFTTLGFAAQRTALLIRLLNRDEFDPIPTPLVIQALKDAISAPNANFLAVLSGIAVGTLPRE